jgi:hypothetical protein
LLSSRGLREAGPKRDETPMMPKLLRSQPRRLLPASAKQPKPKPPKHKVVKANTRPKTKWHFEENQLMLQTAVKEWDNKSGSALDCNGEAVSMTVYSNLVGIQYETFRKYASKDTLKRCKIGAAPGWKPLLDADEQEYVANVVAPMDRVNEGSELYEVREYIRDIHPELMDIPAAHSWAKCCCQV